MTSEPSRPRGHWPLKAGPILTLLLAVHGFAGIARAQDPGVIAIVGSDGSYDTETGVGTLPGEVSVEADEFRIVGRDLTYSDRSRDVAMRQAVMTAKNGASMRCGKLFVNLETLKGRATEGWSMKTNVENGAAVEIAASEAEFDLERKEVFSKGPVRVKMVLPEKGKEEKNGAAKRPAAPEGAPVGERVYDMQAREVRYGYETGAVSVAGGGWIRSEDRALDFGALEGSLGDMKLNLETVDLKYDPYRVTCGKARFDGEKNEVRLTENIVVRKDGRPFLFPKGEAVIPLGEGGSWVLSGGGKFEVPLEELKKKGREGEGPAEGK